MEIYGIRLVQRAFSTYTNSLNPFFEKIQKAVQFALDCLLLAWYMLEHAYEWLFSDTSIGKRVFKKEDILCHTHNYAKYSQLWEYVKLRREPQAVHNHNADKLAKEYGLTIAQNSVWTRPHTGGFCQGGVMTFFQKWFETENINQVVDYMKDGIPIQGALYQAMYQTLFTYSGNLEEVESHIQATFELASLKAEVIHLNEAAITVLNTVKAPTPGAYSIAFPTYGSLGEDEGYHTLSFLINEQTAIFYEPNSCIAQVNKDKVHQTLISFLQEYTGIDHSTGDYPGVFKRIRNFFQDRANPPSTSCTSGIDLFKLSANNS